MENLVVFYDARKITQKICFAILVRHKALRMTSDREGAKIVFLNSDVISENLDEKFCGTIVTSYGADRDIIFALSSYMSLCANTISLIKYFVDSIYFLNKRKYYK